MTGASDISILADHSFWLAVPALAPAIVVAGVVIYIAMRDRRSTRSRGEKSQISDQDGGS